MTTPTSVPARVHELAATLATEAGQLLVALRAELQGRDAEPAMVRAEGDRRSNALLLERLAELDPGTPVLSEEAPDDQARVAADRVWIVDPLDGTREFGEPGRTDWAVHVAYVVGGAVAAAAVALPALDRTLSTVDAPIAPLEGSGGPRFAVSRTRPPTFVTALAHELHGQLVPMGSAGAKAMAVVLGDADAYVHGGGQWEWDSAAPVGVALAAGLHASRLDGSPLRYNQVNPWLPDLVICRPELADQVLEAVAAA
jgi:3'(2'), 5'-bisphosphate nucleotidase